MFIFLLFVFLKKWILKILDKQDLMHTHTITKKFLSIYITLLLLVVEI